VLPNFYVLGAQKAGTTWLYRTLRQHPEVGHAVIKEVHFFDRDYRVAKGIDWYSKQFSKNPDCVDKKAIGDFTPKYLRMVHPKCFENQSAVPNNAIELLKSATPEAKFIIILRNPVRRASSAYFHYLRKRKFPIGTKFSDAPEHLDLLMAGEYAEQLEIWFEHFPRERFLILIYEEDVNPDSAKEETFQKICKFLEINSEFRPENLHDKFNAIMNSFRTRLLLRGGLLERIFWNTPSFIQNLKIWNIEIPAGELEKLEAFYKLPNQKLSEVLGRELPW
jgi:hypothetical protein